LQLASAPEYCAEASLFRLKSAKPSYLDAEIFSDDFTLTLSNAIERAAKRMDIVLPAERDDAHTLANSLPNSA
jgi:hypothetical protein